MSTKPIDRLMFAQGGLCFFCNSPLPKAEASVEHLVASSRAGSNSDENCVACCKAINSLFGSMSLKEKIKVVLNQKGQFKCPNGTGNNPNPKVTAPPKPVANEPKANFPKETEAAVIENLKSRGNSKPRKVKTLTSTIKNLASLKLTDNQVSSLIQHMQASGKIIINGEQVSYKL